MLPHWPSVSVLCRVRLGDDQERALTAGAAEASGGGDWSLRRLVIPSPGDQATHLGVGYGERLLARRSGAAQLARLQKRE